MSWSDLSQEARDLAYNNNAAVPDSAALNAARIAASETARQTRPAHLDVPYGTQERQRWDLFPATDPAAPCLVFIHGGYWQRNRREEFAAIAQGARTLGWSTALPGYTLAPDSSLTQIVGEIHAALDWLGEHGPAHGIAGRVIVSGWSAGGHLAALALSHPAVAAGLAISGIYRLAPLRDTWLNAALRLSDLEIAGLSPLLLPVVPKPLAIAYGAAELPMLVADSRDFFDYRRSAGAPGTLLPIDGANHFSILDELRRPDGALLRAATALL